MTEGSNKENEVFIKNIYHMRRKILSSVAFSSGISDIRRQLFFLLEIIKERKRTKKKKKKKWGMCPSVTTQKEY